MKTAFVTSHKSGLPFCCVAVLTVSLFSGVFEVHAASRPGWIDNPPPHSSTHLFFTGGSGWRATETDARQAASNAAAGEITTYLGALVKSTTNDFVAVHNDKESESIERKITVVGAEVTLRGIEQRAMHCAPVSSGHECTVLISYPRAEYEKAKLEILAAQAEYRRRNAEAAARALDLYRSALGSEAARDYEKALGALTAAKKIVDGFEAPIDLDDKSLKNTTLLFPELTAGITRVGAMVKDSVKWLAVSVVVDVDNRRLTDYEQAAFSKVAALAQSYSLKPKSVEMSHQQANMCMSGDGDAVRLAAGPARYLLVLDLDSMFSTEVSGQFFASASGKWALVESATGRLLYGGPIPRAKGYGISRSSACLMGVDLVAKQAVEDLSRAFEQIRQK